MYVYLSFYSEAQLVLRNIVCCLYKGPYYYVDSTYVNLTV
jgi:hypothetical protein